MTNLLTQDHRILEKGPLEFRPFGTNADGQPIQDASGIIVKANVEYLDRSVNRRHGREAGARAIAELVRLLNERSLDPAYHVTPDFLRNEWNSYSYEFVMFLGEFCKDLSGDPDFPFAVGRETLISPVIKAMSLPLSISEIFGLFPYFGKKYTRGSLSFEVVQVTASSAVIRMRLSDSLRRQFGPYQRACALMICQSSKAGLASIPDRIHAMQSPAVITDARCMAEGDECCEWAFAWTPEGASSRFWPMMGSLATGGATFAYLRAWHPAMSGLEASLVSLLAATALGLFWAHRRLLKDMAAHRQFMEKQRLAVGAQHEELCRAYLKQERTTVELQQTVAQLTSLNLQVESLNLELEAKVQRRTNELERLNQDLAVANSQLHTVDHLKSLFLSHVSHELRTPLTAIKGLVDNLLDGLLGRMDERQTRYLTRVNVNVHRLIRMIAELLDLSRIESGKLDLSPAPVSLCHLVADATGQMQPLVLAKHQTLDIRRPETELIIWADPDKVHQILTNLLDNTIKFTPVNGRITVEIGREGSHSATVSVRDTGMGIAPESLPKVFDLFYQSHHSAAKSAPTGLGLGLAIVKSLTDLHQGTVTVRSVVGRGSEFHVRLPIRPTGNPLDCVGSSHEGSQ